ncbi:lantibiotic dehydratase, partial [Streptomyces sedi]|uniref:lantibiotic dehydratase n=1 Tax=Streptomyces sedi TaxID=555059 RepID=UPI0031EC8E1C
TPHHHTTTTHHHTPARPPTPIDPFTRELLLLCDGVRLPAELARELGPRVGRTVATDEVLEALGALARRRWISWRLSIPASAHPERALRAALERVGDPDRRTRSLAALDRLEAARDRVAAAGRDGEALDEAMAGLEAEFAELTETPARRAKGARTAPCRSLLYSDSRRSATVTLGPALLAELAPMSLCLTAAGWLTARYAERVGARIRETFDRLRGARDSVDLGSLYLACLPAPHAGSVEDIDALQAELRDRWAAIIDAEPGARRVWRSSAELAPRVAEAFGEPGDAWNIARYASPDVLVVAESEEAVNRGEFELVLGELHVAMNTIGASLFVNQHPDPDELLAETDRDFPAPRLMPLLPKEQPPRWSTRSRPALVRPQDYLVALAEHTGDPARPRTVLSGDVLVQDREGRLTAVLPDGATFPLLDVFGNALTNRVMDRFALRPEAPHSPRITVDRMIIARETWRLDPTTLHFAHEKNEAHRFATTRHWATQLGLPRYAFALSPTEPRPFYIDFHSPIYCTILAKAIRRLARDQPHHHLTLTEMLPTPHHTWLTDDQHHHYTAELRFVTVDQTRVESPGAAHGDGDS